jgi:hypothetical protein
MRIQTLLLLILVACTDKDDDTGTGGSTDGGASDGGTSDGGTTDGGTSDGGTSDGGTSDGGSGDGGSSQEDGLLLFSGVAVAIDDDYAGIETVLFLAEEGSGETLCQVELTLESVGTRTDCKECEWAYDVEVLSAETTTDTHCAAVGYDTASVQALVGSVRGYGFNPEYFGHAPVLFAEVDGIWAAVAYASYDETTGDFAYDWEEGLYPY